MAPTYTKTRINNQEKIVKTRGNDKNGFVINDEYEEDNDEEEDEFYPWERNESAESSTEVQITASTSN